MVNMVSNIFIFFILAKKLLESWPIRRNMRFILANKDKVPARLSEDLSLEDHLKASSYSLAKIKTSHMFSFIDILILLSWTFLGGLDLLDSMVKKFVQGDILTGLLFLLSMGFISLILNIPRSFYMTFSLEERFGMNKTTIRLFWMDLFKSVLLSLILALPILSISLWIMKEFSHWWIIVWSFFILVQIFLVWAYPHLIAPCFNKFTSLEEGEVKRRITSLLQKVGFSSNGIFVMDASKRSIHGNAYFTGFGKNKRIVFFDTLIKFLEPEEIEAVLAHELGHFKKRHVLKNFLFSSFVSWVGFALLGLLHKWPPFYEGHGVSSPSDYTALALYGLLLSTYTFFMTPLSSMISRKHEWEADDFAKVNAKADKLVKALVKLSKNNNSTVSVDPLYSFYFHSHPPLLERIERLS